MENQIDNLVEEGKKYLKLQQYEKAIECFDKAIELNPKNDSLWAIKGRALQESGQLKEAIDYYDKAIELNPKNDSLWAIKGRALQESGQLKDAIDCFDKAIELNPKNDSSWINKGIALKDSGQLKEAIECYDKAIELNPKNKFSWNFKGIALQDSDQFKEAIECYDKAIELNPKNKFSWNFKGIALIKNGQLKEAIDYYDKAIELNPENENLWIIKGITLQERGQLKEAIACFDKAIELNPKNDSSWRNKSRALFECGQLKEAIGYYDKAIELNPSVSIPNEYYLQLLRQNKNQKFIEQDIFIKLILELKKFWGEFKIINNKKIYLYQYCPKKILQCMMKNKQFRLSPVSYLNDPLEGRILYDYIEQALKKKTKPNKILQNLIKTNKEKTNNTVFIRSLTNLKDNLIMWNSSYGDYAKGVSIGIPAPILSEKCGSGLQSLNYSEALEMNRNNPMKKTLKSNQVNKDLLLLSNVGLYKIKYIDPIKKVEKLNIILDLLVEFINSINKSGEQEFINNELEVLIVKLFQPLSHVIKHKHFEHENEYRLIFISDSSQELSAPFIQSDIESGKYIQTEEVLFSSRDNELTEIFLGPKMDFIDKLKIRDAFKQEQLNAEPQDSSINFR